MSKVRLLFVLFVLGFALQLFGGSAALAQTPTPIPTVTIREAEFSGSQEIVFQAVSSVMRALNDGNTIFIVRANTGASSTLVTTTAVAEPRFGRATNLTDTLTAGEAALIGPLATDGFNQRSGSDTGYVIFTFGATTNVEIAAYRQH